MNKYMNQEEQSIKYVMKFEKSQ